MLNRTNAATRLLQLICSASLCAGTLACSSGDGDPNPGAAGGSTSTGGSTASGGETNGSGGADGTGGAQSTSVCTNATQTAGPGAVSDLESGTDGWFVYQSVPDDPGTVSVEGELDEDAPDGSDTSIRYAATGFPQWGGGMGFGLGCTDTSALTGVCFHVKGTTSASAHDEYPNVPEVEANKLRFMVAIPETHGKEIDPATGENIGGDCDPDTQQCFQHPGVDLDISAEWGDEPTCVPFSSLSPAGGVIASYQGIVMALVWHTQGPDWDFSIDEVTFY